MSIATTKNNKNCPQEINTVDCKCHIPITYNMDMGNSRHDGHLDSSEREICIVGRGQQSIDWTRAKVLWMEQQPISL